jgi:hypothetical protein
MIASVIVSTNLATQSLFAQAKATHEAAKQCSGCQLFVAPASCQVVEDPIAASGWCQLFVAKQA